MSAAGKEHAKKKFMRFLARRHLRVTAQRQAIVESAFGTDQHFTADQLLAWSRRRDKSVSRATVYRTLPLLTESGLVREMDFGKDHRFYDPNYADHPNHNHLICNDCDLLGNFGRPRSGQARDASRRSQENCGLSNGDVSFLHRGEIGVL